MSRLEAVKEELEKELDTQTNQTHKQVKGWYFFYRTSNAVSVFISSSHFTDCDILCE